jgi:excisionase family DNA binding protein
MTQQKFRKDLMTASEAAHRLNIAKRTLLRWAREGRIDSVRVSRKTILFTEEAVDTFVKSKTSAVESSPQPGGRSAPHVDRARPMKGGGKKSSRKSWRSLREEVTTWQ